MTAISTSTILGKENSETKMAKNTEQSKRDLGRSIEESMSGGGRRGSHLIDKEDTFTIHIHLKNTPHLSCYSRNSFKAAAAWQRGDVLKRPR
jgi:hypothetical protein